MSALRDIRVLELTDQFTPVGGRVLAELGAEVIVVEPPSGSAHRKRPPFVDDQPGADRSLRWWAGNVGKKSVTIDQRAEADRDVLAELIATADIVVAGSDRCDGIDYESFASRDAGLIWISVSAFGLGGIRSNQPATDLTMLAGGGPVWNCGYDDHSLPPIRGAGDQSVNIAGMYCAIAALVALAHRDQTGQGQLVDVSVNAACNVTSEQTTYHWLVNQDTCQRQTGRHAYPTPSSPVQVRCADGRYATTGVLPRQPADFARMQAWLDELGLTDELPESVFLELAASRAEPVDLALIGVDDETTAILSAARDAIRLIASRLPAKEFFLTSQRRGFPCGAVLAPNEAFDDEHTVARGFHVPVGHRELQRTITYPGVPYLFSATPAVPPTPPPLLGEHNDQLDELLKRQR
ncbi:carnitine dehydratase [Mycolicibacter nonchromogenicus]|uniref:Carnitine dehydratase n=1 Tax=Mycolicibacter nonchromogenicus TaxID=1782 RepID=A0A1X1YZ93_MYCNO|nr:CoA transferase [Mycolicibacter nonchromogenicus]ORW16405.1 carnitine dehydratase [Mycolicibacter nonchromogenicus]